MEYQFNRKESAFYEEVDEFLKKTLPPDWAQQSFHWPGGYGTGDLQSDESTNIALQYRRKLIEKGWLTISWPKEYGGKDYCFMEQAIFDDRRKE